MPRRAVVLAALLACVPAVLPAQKVELKESVEELERVAARDTLDAAAQYNVAMGYMSKKRWADAEAALRRALAIEPRFAEAQLALYAAYVQNQAHWKAKKGERTDSVVRANSDTAGRHYARAFLIDPFVDVKILATEWRIWGTSRVLNGMNAFLEGRYEKAVSDFDVIVEDVMRRNPRDSVNEGVLWMHALAAARMKRLDVAQENVAALFRVASARIDADSLETVPLKPNEFRYMQAVLRDRAGDQAGAIRLYQEVLENDISNYMAHVQLANIHEAQRDWPRAIAERRRAAETNPGDASLLTDLGVALGKSGAFDEAVPVFDDALGRNPRDLRPLFWKGIALQQLGRTADARAALERFVALAPPRLGAQVKAARTRLEQLP